MSGVDHYQKRKRKRKTRAERNQVSLYLLEQKKQKRISNYLKDMNPSQNTVYTLRSGKGASHPVIVSRDDVKTRTAAITQGRLTRSLGKLGFTNGKTSDWISRGPISESEDMKKKVESDIKRILRLAEKSTLTGNSDLGAGCLPHSGNKDEEAQATSEPSQDVMEVDCPSHNSPAVDKNISETSDQKTMSLETGTATTATATCAAAQAEVTPTQAADSAAWYSESSNNADETLELEPPVQEIADTILKELKPKFARMFPNRDIEAEICSDLQKLLSHSCCRTEELPEVPTSDFFLPPEYQEPGNSCTPAHGNPTTSASTLSICRQQRKYESRYLYPQVSHARDCRPESNSSMMIQDCGFYPCVNSDNSTNFHQGGDASSSSFNTSFVMQDFPEVEDVMKINVNVEESEDEDSDILSTARYSAFVASARELEKQQKLVLHEDSTFEGASSSHGNSYHHCTDHHSVLQRPCELRHDNSYKHFSREPDPSCWPLDWRNVRAARVLDFSQPNGDKPLDAAPFLCLSRRFNETYPDIHTCHSRMNHSSSQLDSLFNSAASDPSQFSFSSQRSSLPSVDSNSNNLDKRWSCPDVFLSPVGHSTMKSTAPTIGPCLAQSRLLFENAVKFACQSNNASYAKPTEHMDMEGCNDFLSSIHCRSSPLQSHGFLGSKNLMMRPLSELQHHQADLQRQARDFLDDLNRRAVKPHDFVNRQSTSSSRHLLQIASPDSSGSPVWGVSSVMKDFGLDTGSFA
ncbi:hypothetical protein BsWGS_07169 [Bradybaena similaris]